MLNLLFAAVVVIIFAAVISLIEYMLKTKGPLFSGVATPRMRLLALLLGIVFAALFVMELTSSDVIHFIFPILAIALVGYSLGVGALLRSVQGDESTNAPSQAALPSQQVFGESAREIAEEKEPIFPLRRIGRLFLILGVGLVLAAVAVYAAIQVATHPDDPLFPLLVLGIIIVFVTVSMRRLFKGR
jgi:hypothetical protein